jgi:lysine 2,3-aminomutase
MYSDKKLWKGVSKTQWEDWKWQLAHSIETLEDLQQVISITEEEKQGISDAMKHLKMRISPHIANLMSYDDPSDTLRKQFIPSSQEANSIDDSILYSDVNADDRYSKVNGLVHRYPTKVLIFPSNYCGCYCRYCFRRKLKRDKENALTHDDYEKIIQYLQENKDISEVIFSGGDPLVVSDTLINYILEKLSQIEHIKVIRFHTRMIITIPYRITDSLLAILTNYKSRFALYFVIHIDTIRELSEESKIAVSKLVDNGIMCFASCPLLNTINADEKTLFDLWTGLVEHRIKPYYLFHSDPVKGLGHFLVPLSRGLEITKNLYDRMSGLAMPLYCFNVPDGGGHVLITYPYIQSLGNGKYKLTNFEGQVTDYTEPEYVLNRANNKN